MSIIVNRFALHRSLSATWAVVNQQLYNDYLHILGPSIEPITRSRPAVSIITFVYITLRLLFAIAVSISMPRPLMKLSFGSILDDDMLEGPK